MDAVGQRLISGTLSCQIVSLFNYQTSHAMPDEYYWYIRISQAWQRAHLTQKRFAEMMYIQEIDLAFRPVRIVSETVYSNIFES